MFTRALLAGVSVLAIACPTAVMARSGVDQHDVDSSGSRTTAGACGEAKKNLASAKRRLATLKRNDAASQAAIQKAKRKVRKARRAADRACTDDDVLFDVTALDARFDATSTRDP